jgi:16S rRNA (cytosine967-C5)-methyltransferase
VRDERPDLASLQDIQIQMLKKTLSWVKPDGQVYYATCSLEPEEGEEVIRTILHFNLAKIIPFTPDELGIFASSLAAEGWARILPDCLTESGLDSAAAALGNDGFFIARLAPLTA